MAKRSNPIDERLAEMLRLQPFQPFDIKTADGDTIHVVHPDYLARSPSGETAIVFDRDDHMRIINLRMVVTLEPRRQPPSRKGKR